MEANKVFSLTVAGPATESKKWEIYLNGILIYWLDCERSTEICATP